MPVKFYPTKAPVEFFETERIQQERGLPPIDSSENISEKSDNESIEPIDVLLNEAAEILNDLITPRENIEIKTVQILRK